MGKLQWLPEVTNLKDVVDYENWNDKCVCAQPYGGI